MNQQDLHNKMKQLDIVDEGDDETDKHIYFNVVTNSEMYNSEVSMLSSVTKTGYA